MDIILCCNLRTSNTRKTRNRQPLGVPVQGVWRGKGGRGVFEVDVHVFVDVKRQHIFPVVFKEAGIRLLA